MPFALVIFGAVFVIAAVRGSETELGTLLKGDFTGPPKTNFVYWFVSVLLIGSLGYVDALRKFSDAFLALILIGLVLSNKGVFVQFETALARKTDVASTTPTDNSAAASSSSSSSSSSDAGGILGDISSVATIAALF